MSGGNLYLGIDIGGTNIKAAVFDKSGSMIAHASESTPVSSPKPGFYERDLDELRDITFGVIRKAIESISAENRNNIAAVGTTGHGKGLYILDKSGKSIKGIASTDSRAAEIVRHWAKDGTMQCASKLNKQTTLACQPPSILHWIKQNDLGTYDRIGTVLEAKDYIRYILTGECFTEYTDASGTALMNLITKTYDRELFKLYGIDEMYPCMPPLKEASEYCGRVSKTAAELTGLPEGISVCGGMFDIDACALAMGVTDPEPICVITGTWSINEYLSPTLLPEAAGVNHSLFAMEEYYLIEESSATSAGNLDAVLEEVAGVEHPDYRAIDGAVESISPEDCDILFYPFMYGTNSAGLKNAAWLNLRSGAGRAAVLRSIFEGVVFSHNYHISRLLKNRAEKPSVLRTGGGGARSRVWMQMLSDVTGIPVEVVEADELGAMGASIAAAVCNGDFKDYAEAARSMVHVTKTYCPDNKMHDIYAEKYRKYTEALRVLEQLEGIL